MKPDRKRLEDAFRACQAPSATLIAEAMDALETFFILAESGGDFPLPCTLADPDSYNDVLENGLQAVVHRIRFVSLRVDPFPTLSWKGDDRNTSGVEEWYWRYMPKMAGETRRRIRTLDREFAQSIFMSFQTNVLNRSDSWPGASKRILAVMGANTFGILDRFVTLVGLGHEAGARQLLPVVRHLPSIVPIGEDATVVPFVPGHWIVLSG
jgi:hypothetical protein